MSKKSAYLTWNYMEGSDFSHKKGGLCFTCRIFSTNQPFPVLSFSECWMFVYVFCLFTPFLLYFNIICISQEHPTHMASNRKTRHFYKWVIFEKKRHTGKYILGISELLIQSNTDSCCVHITGGVNIYLFEYVSLLAPECAVSLCVDVIWNESSSKKRHYVHYVFSKLEALLHKIHSKVLDEQGLRYIDTKALHV